VGSANSVLTSMHPLVRDLYKRFMLVGLDYPHPEGLAFVRRKVKAGFQEKAHLQDEVQ
jgi:Complex 1 protein (LYR family)